jgi:FtsP/CotA-like multicopper oxidase with cupredoxin domain
MKQTRSLGIARALVASAAILACGIASAQINFTPIALPAKPSLVNNAFPTQNPNGPTGIAFQANYPYPGQCLADSKNIALFPLTPLCTATLGPSLGSFGTPSQRTGSDYAASGIIPFTPLNPLIPNSVPPAGTLATPKFVWNLLNPIEYTPDADTTKFPNADYYEIGVHEAWGFQGIAAAGLFPNPSLVKVPGVTTTYTVPNGMQWTGLVCTPVAGCSCPADASSTFKAMYCTAPGGKIPQGAPLLTPIWGVGQINMGGGPVTSTLSSIVVNGAPLFAPGTPSAWSLNNYVATWPSISIRGTRNRPVIVKWVNEFPNNHVFCPHPEAADWPCAIDRTFMGVKARVDPGLQNGVSADGVNQFGSPQQPDNSWVTHFHGGEIPPSTDGFAEKWFGNLVTAPAYTNRFVNPPFENPSGIMLQRPAGNSDVYTYPMVQEEATVWFHDHTLGKTHHNVIAGPAGFFPIKEPQKHGSVGVTPNTCPANAVAPCTNEYTWLDPVTEPRGGPVNAPLYDLFMAVQDRAFNDDGSINFSNGLGQVLPQAARKAALPIGYSPITNGVNPQVHPTWVPEYFADHALVNGVLWPKNPTAPGWYRLRIVDGSDSRCYTIGFQALGTAVPAPAPGTRPTNNVPFWVIANDQGYLKNPVLAPGNAFTMCPGERYELLVNFGALPGIVAGGAANVYMTNSAAAPFPAGLTPFAAGTPYAEMNVLMRFEVGAATAPAPVKTCGAAGNTWDPTWSQATIGTNIASGAACMPVNPALVSDPNFKDIRPPIPFPAGTIVRQVYMNERADGITLSPMGMQMNGVPFEYKVTETPKKGTREVWQFVNLTVDAHPLHPHLVSHQVVARQSFNVGAYKALLCGSTTCQPGTAPGGEMQVVPNVTPLLSGSPVLVIAASIEGGRKDATQVPPGMVTTIVADWAPRWDDGSNVVPQAAPTAPGTAGCPAGKLGCAAPYVFEDVTTGPYVWHCHINSHEDSEMMRTSLVVK